MRMISSGFDDTTTERGRTRQGEMDGSAPAA